MVSHRKEASETAAEETVRWVLDFLSRQIDDEDFTSRWMLSVEANRHLRLWDTSSRDGTSYAESPKLNQKALQAELSSAFKTYLLPLLEGEKQQTDPFPATPKVFGISKNGVLFSRRLLEKNLEEIAVANFLEALSFLTPSSASRFQKCEGCERWFFPQGKRIRKARRFCSRTCNLRATAKRQRERMKSSVNKESDEAENGLPRSKSSTV